MQWIQPKPILVVDEHLNKDIEGYAWALRELLVAYKVPQVLWDRVWEEMAKEGEEISEPFRELDDDLDVQWITAWFKGVADTLKTEEAELVKI